MRVKQPRNGKLDTEKIDKKNEASLLFMGKLTPKSLVLFAR